MGAKTLKFLLTLIIPCGLSAQIAFDNATDGLNNGGTTMSLSWSHTITTGPAFLGVCFLGDNTGGNDDISSVTYNSVAMSLIQKVTAAGFQNRITYYYGLAGVSAGTNTVAITAVNNHFLIGVSASWSGAATSGQPEASQGFGPTNSSPYTTSLTTVNNNSWMTLCDGGAASAASTGATLRKEGAQFSEPAIYDSNSAITPPASYSMTTTSSLANSWDVHIMASIKLPSTGTTLHLLNLLGVGN